MTTEEIIILFYNSRACKINTLLYENVYMTVLLECKFEIALTFSIVILATEKSVS